MLVQPLPERLQSYGMARRVNGRIACGICGQDFAHHSGLSHHRRVKHADLPRLVCNFPGCGQNYNTRGSLGRHQRSAHSEFRPYKCDVPDCGIDFSWRDSLTRHKKIKHPAAPRSRFQCTVPGCGKDFALAQGLKEHVQRTHLGNIPHYKCNHQGCMKVFTTKIGLKAHQNKGHATIHPALKCPSEGCREIFRFRKDLKAHVRLDHIKHGENHSLPPKLKCDICHELFYRQRALTNHKRRQHSGSRVSRFSCDVEGCDSIYATPWKLREHKRQKHTDNPIIYECNMCGKTYSNSNALGNHKRRVHPSR